MFFLNFLSYLAIATYLISIWLTWSSARTLPQQWRLWALLAVIPLLLVTTGVIHLIEARVYRPHAMLHATLSLVTAVALAAWVYSLKHLHIDLSEYRKSLEAKARYDDLTGLLRRDAWIDATEREMTRAQRSDQPIGFIEFDIDGFKSVNDTYGHAVGDQILTSIAHLCTAVCRPTDIAGRIGGEEFMIALPETTRAEAAMIAERLRVLVSEHQFRSNGSTLGITISLGVAIGESAITNAAHGYASLESLMKAADEAMYSAKSAGKNCVR